MQTIEHEKYYGIVFTRNNRTQLYGKKLWNHYGTALWNCVELLESIFKYDLPKTKHKANDPMYPEIKIIEINCAYPKKSLLITPEQKEIKEIQEKLKG